MITQALTFVTVLLLLSSTAFAQAAVDCAGVPTTPVVATGPSPRVEMTASVDHNVVVSGIAVLTSYAVAVCQGTTLKQQSNIGKPTPDANNKVSGPVPISGLAKNTLYYLVVYAIGPGGSSKTGPVAPFVPVTPPAVDGSGVRILP